MLDRTINSAVSISEENSIEDSYNLPVPNLTCASLSCSISESSDSISSPNIAPDSTNNTSSNIHTEIESLSHLSQSLLKREDDQFDFESEEGQRQCKKFLRQIEKVCKSLNVHTTDRSYRNQFTNAYKVLYKPGRLCYLSEIIDSAQENIPYLWVNSEKYVFSSEVLEAGQKVYSAFSVLVAELTVPATPDKLVELKNSLRAFDRDWAEYEHMYVLELMVIEADARRYIRKAIQAEQLISDLEAAQKKTEQPSKRLISLIGKINSVANVEGKGRDDLTYEILVSALSYRANSCLSVRILALAILSSFENMRKLFRKYAENIEEVDPQLRNNPELVQALDEFENAWEKGKSFLVNFKRCNQLIAFSNYLQVLARKYPVLKEQIECRDAELFLSIPSLLILLKLEGKDLEMARYFCPFIAQEEHKVHGQFKALQRTYNFGKLACHFSQAYFGVLEKAVLGIEVNRDSFVQQRFDNLDNALKIIRTLGLELQRCKPTQWNQFFNVAISGYNN